MVLRLFKPEIVDKLILKVLGEPLIVNESMRDVKPTTTTETVTTAKQIVTKKTMTLKQEVTHVKKTFQSGSGYLVTIEIKQVTETQAILHGIVYYIQTGKPDDIEYEGSLMFPISDKNFQDSQFVLVFNIGDEPLSKKIQSLFKNNASSAISSIIEVIASVGIKVGIQPH